MVKQSVPKILPPFETEQETAWRCRAHAAEMRLPGLSLIERMNE